jgi:hypothetical protein
MAAALAVLATAAAAQAQPMQVMRTQLRTGPPPYASERRKAQWKAETRGRRRS